MKLIWSKQAKARLNIHPPLFNYGGWNFEFRVKELIREKLAHFLHAYLPTRNSSTSRNSDEIYRRSSGSNCTYGKQRTRCTFELQCFITAQFETASSKLAPSPLRPLNLRPQSRFIIPDRTCVGTAPRTRRIRRKTGSGTRTSDTMRGQYVKRTRRFCPSVRHFSPNHVVAVGAVCGGVKPTILTVNFVGDFRFVRRPDAIIRAGVPELRGAKGVAGGKVHFKKLHDGKRALRFQTN